ncbi:TetR/AcrR family transcriptional regulator [Paenibacillus sp. GSMTC-2017]|uniref:TetR/AcrR family transcriptional regulator n=1 Tax=Paenibacillus sp. GSMTC-2017 TaxID=2794350 RepID=UPI0018D96678|nr:TetR/AcrR family transcriptional regulator [Paenibacillus sp. GSMTC-2017]
MSKKQNQTIETKAKILEAAHSLFSKKGYNAASIEEIAALTGTSKANIYYHFKSKEGLIFSLLDQNEAEWKALWKEQRTHYDTITAFLNAMVEISLTRNLQHPLSRAIKEFLDDSLGKPGEVREKIIAKFEDSRLYHENLIKDGIDSGEFKPGNPAILSVVFETMIRGLFEASQGMELKQSLELYQTALHVFFTGISNKTD